VNEREEEDRHLPLQEVTLGEIREWIDRGYQTFDELKRVLRVGMGPCQGRGCREMILRELSLKTGKPVSEIHPGTFRPPSKPVKLSLLAAGGDT